MINIKDINKIETICILYRITGKWNWFGNILTDRKFFPFIIMLYCIHATNMGFEDRIWNNIENNIGGGKNVYLINGITLISILPFYLINRFGGKCLTKFLMLIKKIQLKLLLIYYKKITKIEIIFYR